MGASLIEEIVSRLQSANWLPLGTGMVSAVLFCGVVMGAQILLIPVTPFSIYAGFTFGFWRGFAVIISAKMLSAFLNFSLSRWVARDWGKKLSGRYPLVQSMNDALVQEGLRFAILLRMCPVPFGVANYGFGLSGLPMSSFTIATFVSIIIPSLTLTALGVSMHQGLETLTDAGRPHSPWQMVATMLSLAAMFLVARRIALIAMKRVKETKQKLDTPS
ncbi:MAG: SNARE-associated domain [Verrucomicrobia bacterium]|nr:MAG: SNARE-associated domain [Verrucomicrobiota bacterium]